MFTAFLKNSKTMSHEIKSVVIDIVARRIATEQRYIGEMLDGTRNDMHNCNFFDLMSMASLLAWLFGWKA